MSDSRQFRHNADTCEQMAKASPFAADREEFRRMAARWRAMADEAEARETGAEAGGADREPHRFDRRDRRS